MGYRSEKDAVPALIECQRLIDDLLTGTCRTHFRHWEIELLLDVEESLRKWKGSPEKILREYRAAVEESWEDGGTGPMKFSEYLARQSERKPTQSASVHRKEQSA